MFSMNNDICEPYLLWMFWGKILRYKLRVINSLQMNFVLLLQASGPVRKHQSQQAAEQPLRPRQLTIFFS